VRSLSASLPLVGLALRANLVCLELCCGPRPLLPATHPSRSPAPPFCSYPLQIRPPYSVIFPASASPTSCLQLLYSVIFPASTFAPLHRSSAPICTFAPASHLSSVLCNLPRLHLSTFAQELCSDLHFYTASCLPPPPPTSPSATTAPHLPSRSAYGLGNYGPDSVRPSDHQPTCAQRAPWFASADPASS